MGPVSPTIKFMNPEDIYSSKDTGSILYTDTLTPAVVIDLHLSKKINHIIQQSNLTPDQELKAASRIVAEPESFLSFPLATLMSESSVDAQKESELQKLYFEISEPTEKQNVLDKVEAYLKEQLKSISLINDILSVADELYTNAIYNAPYVDFTNSTHGAQRGFQNIKIDQAKKPTLVISDDNESIVVACVDHYGKLNTEKLFATLKQCYHSGVTDMINYSTGGAGIGYYMIMEKTSRIYFGVKKNQKTLVCCSFAKKKNSAARSMLPKNLHVCNF